MVTPARFRRPPGGSPPPKLPRNSIILKILRTTPLFLIFCARNVPYLHENKYSRGRGGAPSYNAPMKKDWTTKLIHSDARVPEGYRSLATPTYRGSTTLFNDAANVSDDWNQYEVGYTYGLYGTPTTLELAAKICELEGGFRTLITPGGQCAVSTINFAFLKAGDHILMPESVYGPNRKLARFVLRRFGV